MVTVVLCCSGEVLHIGLGVNGRDQRQMSLRLELQSFVSISFTRLYSGPEA